jgi:hypothetical protein
MTSQRQEEISMREFDHVGLTTTVKQEKEMWVEETRVWVTNPGIDMIEYLRYEPDSPVDVLVRERPHLAFRTDDLDKEMEGARVVLGPFKPTPDLTVVFIEKEGALWEYMESKAGKEWFKTT